MDSTQPIIEYQVKLFTYPPTGPQQGVIVCRIEDKDIADFENQMTDPKSPFLKIPIVMPEIYMADEEPIQRNQFLVYKKENIFGYIKTPLNASLELQLHEEKMAEIKRQEEEAKVKQEEAKTEILGEDQGNVMPVAEAPVDPTPVVEESADVVEDRGETANLGEQAVSGEEIHDPIVETSPVSE